MGLNSIAPATMPSTVNCGSGRLLISLEADVLDRCICSIVCIGERAERKLLLLLGESLSVGAFDNGLKLVQADRMLRWFVLPEELRTGRRRGDIEDAGAPDAALLTDAAWDGRLCEKALVDCLMEGSRSILLY